MMPGALVRTRGRRLGVLPSHEPELLLLRPLTGATLRRPASSFPSSAEPSRQPPLTRPILLSPATPRACMLLRDAVRLSLRAGAAPFRSLGRISVTPRPYQFVPLIMALRLDPRPFADSPTTSVSGRPSKQR